MHSLPKHTIPAFHEFVPRFIRIGLFVLFALIFQFSNTVYLNLTGTLTGANQMLKEDLTFLFQMTMAGLTCIYPLLFRFKLRFTSRQIITWCALIVAAMMGVVLYCESVVLLAIASFILGAAKMVGTFETLVSIQLIITPKRDYGVFFSIALGLVLLSGQLSGILAVHLNYSYNWKALYNIMIGANAFMLLLAQLLLRPIRVVKKLPLYGIDWLGFFLWGSLLSTLTYVFCYGQLLDWFSSSAIRITTFLSLVIATLIVFWMFTCRRPYISPIVFTIRSINTAVFIIFIMQPFLSASGSVMGPFTTSVLGLDDLASVALNWWVVSGIVVGILFSYSWFRWYNGSFKLFFVIAFSSLSLYYLILYFTIGTLADSSILSFPYFLRGFGTILLFAGTGKYITKDASPAILTQALFYLAMVRNAIGSLIPASLLGYVEYIRTMDFHTKLVGKIDVYGSSASILYTGIYNRTIIKGSNTFESSIMAGKVLFTKVNQQAILLAGHEIFGFMVVLGIALIALLLLLHFSSHITRRIPSWGAIRSVLRF